MLSNPADKSAMDWENAAPSVWWNFSYTAPVAVSPALSVVVEQCIDSKRTARRRENYVKQLNWTLRRFMRGRESVPISTIGVQELENYLKGKTAWSRNTLIAQLGALFAFADKRGYLLSNPIRRLDRAAIDMKPPVILKPEQARELLDVTLRKQPKMLAGFVLGLFAGIRPTELTRITWESVDLTAATVRIEAAASKVRRRRLTPLQPAAVEWLKIAHRNKSGNIMPTAHIYRRQSIRRALSWGWPADILRHTAASMLLALHQDVAKVAFMLGNSPRILMTHYHENVTADDCTAFWSIRP